MFESVINLPIWDYSVGVNTAGDIAIAVAAFFGFLVVLKVFQGVVLHRLRALAKKTKTDIDDALVRIIGTLKPPFYLFVAFYFALKLVTLDPTVSRVIDIVLIVWVIYQAVMALQVLVDYTFKRAARREEEESTKTALRLIGKITKGVLWMIGALLILSNLGINITSLIAGLGIGGIAVALALQNVLGDLFSSFAIFFDKPFVAGDFIIVGDIMGVVEHIGIKTTRIRSLQGEEIVISNQELTSAQIRNFKNMEKRRVVIHFGVTYDTPQEKLKDIPKMVKRIINEVNGVQFDRAHFYQFGDSSLDFEVVYYIESSDYQVYMDVNQEIMLEVREAFDGKGISMAYPTRTIYIEK